MAGLGTVLVWALMVGGVLGVLGQLVPAMCGSLLLRLPRDLAVAIACLATPVLYSLMALGPRLPKGLLVPLCWTVAWSLAGAMPVLLWAGLDGATGWVSGIYACAGGTALLWLRDRTGRWGLTSAWLARRGATYSPRHLAKFTAVHAVVVPLVLALYVASSAAMSITALTDGYVNLRADGIYLRERVLASGDRRVRLVGMIHIGDPGFYSAIAHTIGADDQIVLREGVTDREARLVGLDYGGLAGTLGLATQQAELEIAAVTTQPRPRNSGIPYSDVDASELSPATLDLLSAVGAFYREPSVTNLLRYVRLATSAETARRAWADIVTFRNKRVLASLDSAVRSYERIAIPWGALHMPGIEAGLRDRGFTFAEERFHRAIGFFGESPRVPKDVPHFRAVAS